MSCLILPALVLASGAEILAPDGTPDPAFPEFHSWYCAEDGVNEHRINSGSVASGDAAMQQLRGFILGARYTVNFFLDGAIAELLVYDAVLSAPDRQAIECYLLEKHPVTEPEEPPAWVDVFASGDVGFGDLLTVLASWGPCG